jgi:hypothetical protein
MFDQLSYLINLSILGAGFGLRKDNPDEFKKLLNEVQSKASSTDVSQLQDSYVMRRVNCVLKMYFTGA